MAVTKKERAGEFSASAYLVVGEPDTTSTWKLRVEETPGQVTQAQLGRAAAALSSGGYRGRRVEITDEERSAAKRKLRALYKKHGWDAPDSLKASEPLPGAVTGAEINGTPSLDDLRCRIQDALTENRDCCCSYEDWPFVLDVAADAAIVRIGDDTWQYPFTADGDDVTLGEPVRVTLSWRKLTPAENAEEDAEGEPAPVPMAEAGTMAFSTDLRGLTFAEGEGAVWVEVCRDGAWDHPSFGHIEIDSEKRRKFVENFSAQVRRAAELPLDYDHKEGPAAGWVRSLRVEGSKLYAQAEFTPQAKERIRTGEYRYFSPEWHPDYVDRETGVHYGPTLIGGGLTNRPFIRGMAAIQCSEGAREAEPKGHPPSPPVSPEPGGRVMAEPEGTITAAEAQTLREEVGRLRMAEHRRQVTDAVGALTFSERTAFGTVTRKLAPSSRTALQEALLPLSPEQRDSVMKFVSGITFMEAGERGFTLSDELNEEQGSGGAQNANGTVKLAESERERLLSMSEEGRKVLAAEKKKGAAV